MNNGSSPRRRVPRKSNGNNVDDGNIPKDVGKLIRTRDGRGLRRKVPEAVKAAAISAVCAGGSIEEVSEVYGISYTSLWNWCHPDSGNDRYNSSPPPYRVEDAKLELAARFEKMAFKLVEAAGGKIENANLLQTMTSAAIAVDKMRLLREQATSIKIVDDIKTEEERDAKLFEILMQVKDRMMENSTKRIEGGEVIDVEPQPVKEPEVKE